MVVGETRPDRRNTASADHRIRRIAVLRRVSGMPADTAFRSALAQPSNGLWLSSADPQLAHALASAFDWACIDEQHGYATAGDTGRLIDAVQAAQRPALVRVAWNRPELIGRALDSGATGVIVPMVESADEARQAVRAARYAPYGRRSLGPIRSSLGSRRLSIADAEAGTVCLVMVESPEALERVNEIAATPGLDGIFVGPFDLSLSLGREVDELLSDTSAEAPIGRIVEACRLHGIVAAGYAGALDRAPILRQCGFAAIAATSDTELVQLAAREAAARLS